MLAPSLAMSCSSRTAESTTFGLRLQAPCALVAILLLAACGPPVGVKRVSPRTVSRDLTQSALNSDGFSLFSQNVLHRSNLAGTFRGDPEGALASLHQLVMKGRGGEDTLFALAELSFKHAEDAGKREFYLEAAVCAWAFLFPEDDAKRPSELDPRIRIAADLYNRGLTRALSSANGAVVELRSGLYALPFGQRVVVHLDPHGLRWADRALVEFVPAAELRVRGLHARYRRPGIGAPLAAKAVAIGPAKSTDDYLGPNARTPVTALLRIEDAKRQLTQPQLRATLEVYNPSDRDSVVIAGREAPLEVEPTAALAWTLSDSPLWRLERRGFFLGDLLGQEIPTSLTFSQPFRHGLIPVVFVHGTASSAGRWANMLNDLENDPRVRDRFQFWFFHYPSGSPIPYSAMLLRDALTQAVARLDPDGRDPALHQMVVLGHSQGGLVAKMTAIDSGTHIWEQISSKPIDRLELSPETRNLLERSLIVQPLPFVRVVVFIATPHRGSALTTNLIARSIARFVRLPADVLGATADLLEGNGDALLLDPRGPRFGSIYAMRPGTYFLTALANTRIDSGIAAHSIIAVRGPGPGPGASDGVVTYESASIDGVASELVIPFSGHSVQGHPLAVAEVRRILLDHAAEVCARSGVACGSSRQGSGFTPR